MKSKAIVIISLIISLFCLDTKAQYFDKTKVKKTYYVSSSEGNNKNNGLSEKKPKKTIDDIKEKSNIVIKLKCGDVFFESISKMNNCHITSYGKGDKPILCALRILKDPNAWVKEPEEDIWSLDLTNEKKFCGYNISKNDEQGNNIGLIYDAKEDKVYGHNVQYKRDLKKNGDFFTNEYYKDEDIKKHPFKKIYFRSHIPPKEMGNLTFSTWRYGISNMNGCIIEGIGIVGFGKHGICSCNNTKIENCNIDLIGGSIQTGYQNWVRFGNGIEFWHACKNDTVRGCLISRTFDCGTTIQCTGNMSDNPENIHITGNRFYHCRQAFEHFLNPLNGFKAEYKNCSFENNICYEMGNNEFSSPEGRDCNILSYENRPANVHIKNNTFFGAPHYCGKYYTDNIKDNKVYIYKDQYLNHYHINKFETILANGEEDIAKYRERIKDNSEINILERNSIKDWFWDYMTKRKVNWTKPNLQIEKHIK